MTLIKQPTPENILLAARNLKGGALIGLPTETVYGLAADAENESAVRRIYEVKGRPLDHPVIVHIGSLEYLEKWAIDIPEFVWKIVDAHWPGPLTIILKKSKLARNFLTGGQDSVGIRMPNHSEALKVLNKFHNLGGNGLAAPSANLFGAVSPTTSQDVEFDVGGLLESKTDLIIDGGECSIGIESTILNCYDEDFRILRKGAISEADIFKISREKFKKETTSFIHHSGDFVSHYAPKAKVVIGGKPGIGSGLIALSTFGTPIGCIRLANPINSEEFGRMLYGAFRKGDKIGLKTIHVFPPVGKGIELAIMERIYKASGSRIETI